MFMNVPCAHTQPYISQILTSTTPPPPSLQLHLAFFHWVHSLIVFRKMKNRPVSPLRTKLNSYQQSNEWIVCRCVFVPAIPISIFRFSRNGFEHCCFVGVSFFFFLFFPPFLYYNSEYLYLYMGYGICWLEPAATAGCTTETQRQSGEIYVWLL